MKNMKKLTALTVALMMTAGVAVAADQMQPPRGEPMQNENGRHGKGGMKKGDRNGLPFGMEELNLTDAQKTKIKAIMEADRPQRDQNMDSNKMAQMKQKMETYQNQERALMGSKNFDENAARRMIAERAQQRTQDRAEMEKNHAERELQMLKKRHAVFQVLTPAQQKQYQENQQKKMAEMQKRHENRFPMNNN